MKDKKSQLLILLSAVILFLVFYFQNIILEKDNTYRFLSKFTADLQIKQTVFYFNFEINNKMTGLTAPDVSFTKTESLTDEYFLSDLAKNKPLLIYRYSDINCNTCYETEINAIHDTFSDLSKSVIILCSYRLDKDYKDFKRINQIKTPLFRISFDAFSWTVEDYGNPYYFVLHPNMKISHIYVPDKKYPDLNKQYLEGVKRFLSE